VRLSGYPEAGVFLPDAYPIGGYFLLKSINCAELSKADIGKKVKLAGWVDRRRDHGQLIFIDLRDRSGIVQIVFNPEVSKASHEIASQLRGEFVVQVNGVVSQRPTGTENSHMATGEVEVNVDSAVILNTAKTPPFYINEDTDVNENVRLKYRYLDLRREKTKETIILRHEIIRFMREYLYDKGFWILKLPF
jgi:aspartyl-tRNA synthetase